ncbi:sulfatase-like hydrolase/transferase [Microvirga pudoricolor]|uniref:sulfatase-like hydrolase/transferase n=1 Tax=Microvirga pudoricolor TaxID=2778729 RepID=UPI00194F69B1|nr:sulfatase-like hydrolase/transferase [Microvirga pudoricolor]MBM6593716.1 sulfatase-like hydrolase/transferase [Microvirga pudoricolor]
MRSQSALLGLAAGILISVILFVALPAGIFAGNTSEFSFSIQNMIGVYAKFMAIPVAIGLVPALLLPRRYALIWASLMGALAVYAWFYGNFIVYQFGLIDGKTWSLNVPFWQSGLELLAILVGMTLVFLFAKARPAILALGLLLVAGGNAYSAWPVIAAHPMSDMSETDLSKLYRFSKDKNVLVVLLDSMQSDVFEEILKEDPKIAAAFKGFTYYPDTAGVAPTTYLSVPAIHSGIEYDGTIPVPDYYQKTIAKGSFLNQLADKGYDTALVNPILGICPEKIAMCPGDASVLGGRKSALSRDAAYLLDVSLLRLAPLALKDAVYNRGDWTFAPFLRDPRLIQHSVRGNNVLLQMAERLDDSAGQPTAKYLHLFSTHQPSVMDESCTYVGESRQTTRRSFKTHVHCGLKALSVFFGELEKKGLYDKTAIAVFADHGIGLANARSDLTSGLLPSLMGSANPTFAFKPIGAKGDVRFSDQPISLADASKIICESVGDCAIARQTSPDGRVFNHYQWLTQYWRTNKLPSITRYVVGSPLWNEDSWQHAGAPAPIGETVSFKEGGNSQRFRFYGWGSAEDWGSWTSGSAAGLSFRLPADAQHLSLDLDTRGFLSTKGRQTVRVYANKELIGTLQYADDTREQRVSFPIPDNALRSTPGRLTIKFEIAEPTSAQELVPTSPDTRKLGLGLHSLSLRATGA